MLLPIYYILLATCHLLIATCYMLQQPATWLSMQLVEMFRLYNLAFNQLIVFLEKIHILPLFFNRPDSRNFPENKKYLPNLSADIRSSTGTRLIPGDAFIFIFKVQVCFLIHSFKTKSQHWI